MLTKLSVNHSTYPPCHHHYHCHCRYHCHCQTNCARTLPGRRGCLKRWKQARNVPPVIQITSKLADNYTRITARLAQRHRQEQQQQQQEYRAGILLHPTPSSSSSNHTCWRWLLKGGLWFYTPGQTRGESQRRQSQWMSFALA